MPLQRIALERRPAPLSIWGGRALPTSLVLIGLALCAVSLVPLVGSFWILLGAVAEHYRAKSPPLWVAGFCGVVAAWSWSALWNDAVEALQAHFLRPDLDRLLVLLPPDLPYIQARIQRGTGESYALPDVGYLVATGTELCFIGARTQFKVRRADTTKPARRTRMDTVILPVGKGKSGLFFTTIETQELVVFINQWLESTEAILAQSVDKPQAQG